ncbi:MAG TPA: V-type ATP synthase subunit E family protein [Candidatus Krumholzibacterium sp.]|nr:V-type ATP synthase subunit E family protein [Candidatus Krumholzibacterium sp.]
MADNESVEKIISQIQEDGEQEISSILSKAESTASGILEKAAQNAGEIAEKILKDARDRGELTRRRLLSSVSIEVKRARLKAREEIISKINDMVRTELERVRGSEGYPDIMAGLIVEAVLSLEGDSFQVYADRRDLSMLEEKVFPMVKEALVPEGRKVARLEAMQLEKDSLGGARVGVPGGRVVFDNTFEARMYRLRDRTRDIIFEEVFETEGSEGSGSA